MVDISGVGCFAAKLILNGPFLLQAKAVVAALTAAVEKVSKALASQTAVGEDPVAIKTPAMALSTVKKLPSELAGSKLKVGDGDFAMPKGKDSGNGSEPVDMKVNSKVTDCHIAGISHRFSVATEEELNWTK